MIYNSKTGSRQVSLKKFTKPFQTWSQTITNAWKIKKIKIENYNMPKNYNSHVIFLKRRLKTSKIYAKIVTVYCMHSNSTDSYKK